MCVCANQMKIKNQKVTLHFFPRNNWEKLHAISRKLQNLDTMQVFFLLASAVGTQIYSKNVFLNIYYMYLSVLKYIEATFG